jgi:CBS domain-containing protein
MEKKIRDIMIPVGNRIAISADASFKDAVSLMKKSFCPEEGKPCTGYSTLMVYDNNILVGLLTLDDLLKAIEPQYLTGKTYRGWSIDTAWSIPVFWEGLFSDRTYEAIDKKVRDIMNPADFRLDADDTLIKAVYGMGKQKIYILPVMEEGRVIGMVRSIELFREICEFVLGEEASVLSLSNIFNNKQNKVAQLKQS